MLISIVIPTRDRAEVLQYCLATCARIGNREVEFIVSDNASMDDTAEVAAKLQDKDSRFRYVRTPRRCSMRQNFEFGVSHARGDYIFTLGDDDAPIPNQFPYLRSLLERHKPDTLTGSTMRYNWPGPAAFQDMGRIKVTFKSVYGASTVVSGEQVREELERNGTFRSATLVGSYTPSIYRGGVSRRILEALSAKSGQVFMATWPDVYFTFASPAVVERHLIVPHPFFVSGASRKSNSASFHSWKKNEKGGEEYTKFLAETCEDPVADTIPVKSTLQIGRLSHLESANRYAFGNALHIDYEREIGRAISSLYELDQEKREEGLREIAQFASGRNLPAALCDAEALLSRCEPASGKKKPRPARAKRRSYFLAHAVAVDMSGAERTDIDAAVAAYEHLIGQRTIQGGWARWFAWTKLLGRASQLLMRRSSRSLQMQQAG